ncbi:MAG: hypothetical protein IJ566_08550 [Cardiobacteriaceae bacterium]|nr:hypothetical protein [Cardiobacteriaceae bacterium]
MADTYAIELRSDVNGIPHSFVVLYKNGNIEAGYGLGPEHNGKMSDNGKIYKDVDPTNPHYPQDGNHEYSASTGPIPITEAGYKNAMDFIKTSQDNPPPYSLFFGSQCANWAYNALERAGVEGFVSSDMQPENIFTDLGQTIIWNPYTQWLSMKLQGEIERDKTDDLEQETPDIKPAESVKSPLAIDMNGDGIETSNIKNGVYFDIDSDRFAEKTAWLNGKDAFLAIDRNGNSIIDNASKLFGDSEAYANGFEALKALDSNGDGIIDANDIAWEDLILWIDAVNDGVSQENEIITAADAGIAYIELNYKNQEVTDDNGNQHRQTATVHWQDGRGTVIEDIWFQHDNAKTIDMTPLNVSDEEWAELAELPYIVIPQQNSSLLPLQLYCNYELHFGDIF